MLILNPTVLNLLDANTVNISTTSAASGTGEIGGLGVLLFDLTSTAVWQVGISRPVVMVEAGLFVAV